MNIDKLEVGNSYKNYKVLCEVLGENPVTSNSKKSQMKNWNRYFSYTRKGQNFIIEEIYDTPLERISRRNGGNNVLKKHITITNPLLAAEWLIEDNGMEIPLDLTRRTNKEYWWGCHTCLNKTYSTPIKKLDITKGVDNDHVICPYCNMSNGAKAIYRFFTKYSFNFKNEYLFDDLQGLGNKPLRFDFAVFSDDKLITLIEFDGEYHDKDLNPDPDNYMMISTHDRLKDEYCFKNNIPLLRIHHTKSSQINTILLEYFLNFKLSQTQIEEMNRQYNLIVNLQKEIDYHISRTEHLKTELSNLTV